MDEAEKEFWFEPINVVMVILFIVFIIWAIKVIFIK